MDISDRELFDYAKMFWVFNIPTDHTGIHTQKPALLVRQIPVVYESNISILPYVSLIIFHIHFHYYLRLAEAKSQSIGR